MDSILLNYVTGEEVHAGDRVRRSGSFATVVFVSDGVTEEYSPGYEDYRGYERGIILCDDDGDRSAFGEPDESLEFMGRG